MQTIDNSLLQLTVDDDAQLAHLTLKNKHFDFLQDEDKSVNLAFAFPSIKPADSLTLALPWTVVDKGDARVSLTMIDNAASYKRFPYHFELMVTYAIEATQVKIAFNLKNNSNKAMPFSLGLACPLLSSFKARAAAGKIDLQRGSDLAASIAASDFTLQANKGRLTALHEKDQLAAKSSKNLRLTFTVAQ